MTKFFVILFAIFVVSFCFFVATNGFVRELASIPIIGTLMVLLWKVIEAEVSHQRRIMQAEIQNSFLYGSTSHMAQVAFDKHVLFCEEYIKEVSDTIWTLFAQGATPEALNHRDKLHLIKEKHLLWLTPEIEGQLLKFEKAIGKLGANAMLARDNPREIDMNEIHEMHRILHEVMGIEQWRGETLSKELSHQAIINHLRTVLGIESLTKLRGKIAESSSRRY
jgi:hypothetical protein